jgi:hypothetical protein
VPHLLLLVSVGEITIQNIYFIMYNVQQEQAQSILTQVRRNALEEEQIARVERLFRRAGVVFEPRSSAVGERLLKHQEQQEQQQQAKKEIKTSSNVASASAESSTPPPSVTNNGSRGNVRSPTLQFPRVPMATGKDMLQNRQSFASARQNWESDFQQKAATGSSEKSDSSDNNGDNDDKATGNKAVKNGVIDNLSARSALGSRGPSSASEKATNFVSALKGVDETATFIRDRTYREETPPTSNGVGATTSASVSTTGDDKRTNTVQFGPQSDDHWNQMYAILGRYYRDHDHSNVPLNYAPFPKLGVWVQLQREQYHFRNHGDLTPRQIDLLDIYDFDWQGEQGGEVTSENENVNVESGDSDTDSEAERLAEQLTSDLVAKAGAGDAFEGQQLGIGGLEDVLKEIKRRIWVPLAAPPSLLAELGINPVRGLLLYGQPG